jgi:predicted phage terminase large subunit-like protein
MLRAERERRIRERDRERIRNDLEGIRERDLSLYAFVKEHWSTVEPEQDFVEGWAIEAICNALEAVTFGLIQYLLITCIPGLGKSLIVSVFWPAWEWGPRDLAGKRYLASSFSLENVTRDNLRMRSLVESEKYQALYGDRVRPDPAKWGERRFQNLRRGVRAGRSFRKMTGGRGDAVIIDDPHDVDSAESDTQRPNEVKTFREAIPDRLNDMQRSSIVVIMQRLHANDVAGTIIRLKLPYAHLNLPMEYEPDRACVLKDRNGNILFVDPRTRPGELLFPERFPRSVVDGLKASKGDYAYAGQYQQRPTAREGGLFKRQWFEGKILDRARLPSNIRKRARGWDFAATKPKPGSAPDWSASARIARDGEDYFVEHVERFQETPAVTRSRVKQRAEVDPRGTVIRIPVEPGQAGVDQRDRYVEYLAGFPVSAVRPTGSKEVRAQAFAIQCETGHVYLVNSGPPEEGLDAWIEPFLDELCSFPYGSNDDQVDSAADGFNEIAPGNAQPFEAMSGGRSEVLAEVSRDRRYQSGHNDGDDGGLGSGWGSSRQRIGI